MHDFLVKLAIALLVKAIEKVASGAYAANVAHALQERLLQRGGRAALASAIMAFIRGLGTKKADRSKAHLYRAGFLFVAMTVVLLDTRAILNSWAIAITLPEWLRVVVALSLVVSILLSASICVLAALNYRRPKDRRIP